MRRLRRWGMASVLLVGMAVCAAQAADREGRGRPQKAPAESETKWGWVNPASWFGSKEKPQEKALDPKGKKGAKKDAESATTPLPSPVDEARGRRAREEANLWRRLEVCDRLREIALRNDDQVLLQRVDELADRAFAVYTQHTGTGDSAVGSGLDAEQRGPDRTGDAAALLRRSGEEPIHSVTGSGATGRADVKEVDR